MGMTNPGPDKYNPNINVVSKKYSSCVSMKIPSKGLDKSWRFVKTNKPDMGSYEPQKSVMN
jgi:hypothetical protein